MELLSFDVAGHACAVQLLRAREILTVPHVTRVPGAPAALRGLVHVCGQAVPVVDVAVRLGAPPAPVTRSSVLVLVEALDGEDRAPCALLVDAVDDILAVAAEALEERPATGPLAGADAVSGFVTSGERNLLLLDLDILLDRDALHRTPTPRPAAASAGREGVAHAREEEAHHLAPPSQATPQVSGASTPASARCARPPAPLPAAPGGISGGLRPFATGERARPARTERRAPATAGGPDASGARNALGASSPASRRPTPRGEPVAVTGARPPSDGHDSARSAAFTAGPAARADRVPAPPSNTRAGECGAIGAERRGGLAPLAAAAALAAVVAGWLVARAPVGGATSAPAPSIPPARPATGGPPAAAVAFPSPVTTPAVAEPRAAASSSQPALPPRPPTPADRVVVVQPGDTLWSLAWRHRKDPRSWPELYRANGEQVHDPDLILPGQRLVVPAATKLTAR